MPIISCNICNKETTSDNSIRCDVCKAPFHTTCSGLQRNEVLNLKNRKLIFHCDPCTNKAKDERDLITIINELKSEIHSLKQQISIQDNARNSSNFDFEEIISEITDRDQRKNNLIFYGINESAEHTSTARFSHDKKQITEIIKIINANVDVSQLSPIRLGKFDANKIRPIKVRLQDLKHVHEIIHNVNKLSSNDNFKLIRISLDRTQRQINYFKKVKGELNTRISDGEENLRIKYIRGIPTIISLN